MSLADIRQELLVATPKRIRAHTERAAALAPESAVAGTDAAAAPDDAASPPAPGRPTALDHARKLRGEPAAAQPSAPFSLMPPPPASGCDALEQ
jgi:hypothetical protein